MVDMVEQKTRKTETQELQKAVGGLLHGSRSYSTSFAVPTQFAKAGKQRRDQGSAREWLLENNIASASGSHAIIRGTETLLWTGPVAGAGEGAEDGRDSEVMFGSWR